MDNIAKCHTDSFRETLFEQVRYHGIRRIVCFNDRFLQLARNDKGIEDALMNIRIMEEQTKRIMTMLGAKNLTELQQKDLFLAPAVQNWCHARGIDWQVYANRSQKAGF